MIKINLTSGMVAVLVFFTLSWLCSGAPSNAPLFEALNPIQAISGVAFALAFAAGLPVFAAIMLAIALFTGLPIAVCLGVQGAQQVIDHV